MANAHRNVMPIFLLKHEQNKLHKNIDNEPELPSHSDFHLKKNTCGFTKCVICIILNGRIIHFQRQLACNFMCDCFRAPIHTNWPLVVISFAAEA